MLGGSFVDSIGREVAWNVVEVHDYAGEVHSEGDMEDYLSEADRVFYEVTVGGETYFRWVAGPYESVSDVENAIADEVDFYADAA